jgi:EAL domain-containing protein (putative c-di-GMP-specific phosphodiesterase class I)
VEREPSRYDRGVTKRNPRGSRPKWTFSGGADSPKLPRATKPSIRGLARADLGVVFQPIVDLAARQVFAYEALTRRALESTAPKELFEQASREDTWGRLGRLIREIAFERGAGYPLFINVHPAELSARWLVRPDDPIYQHNHHVFLEITESATFTHYETCLSVLREVRSRANVRLAIDDLGAGYSNLMRVIQLEPQAVKLDRELVTGLQKNKKQQRLVCHLAELCKELGAEVVAEGIESADELSAVIDCGVPYGQGWVFARPAFPLPSAVWPGGEVIAPETALKRGRARK